MSIKTALIALIFFLPYALLSAFEPIVSAYPMHRSQVTDQTLVDDLLTRFSISKSHLTSHNRARYWQQYYLKDSYHLQKVLHNMAPFIPLMIKSLDAYSLPGEIALIPVIECCYHTTDVSDKGAKGLWQINPITAEHLDLKSQWDYQPCFDVQRSTQAALIYLADLHARFGSWPLALAAYNAGPQAVQKALSQAPYRSQKDLESLPLPEQTKDFVAKIQALAQILQHYDHYGVVIPSQADPLVLFSPKLPIDTRDLMLAFNLPLPVIEQYNPAITHYKTPKGHRYSWLIPSSYLQDHTVEENETRLYQSRKHPFYQVKKGDNLTRIAQRFGLKTTTLTEQNGLTASTIFPGQKIFIPPLAQYRAPIIHHQVQSGESLWRIAQQYGASWEEIKEINNLTTSHLKPEQWLIIPASSIKKIT